MATVTNTIGTVAGANAYGGANFNGGFQKTVSELRKYEKALLKFLSVGDRMAHTKYLLHKQLPKNMGDTINLRRYFDLAKDPRVLKFDKNKIEGVDLKELHGAAVEFKLEWYGNGVQFNDVVTKIHLDDLMKMAMPMLMKNAAVVRDNIAALATLEGASKASIKAYDGSTGAVTLGTDLSNAEAAGPLNHSTLRHIAKLMINNTETYAVTGGNVTVRAKINPVSNGKYRVLLSEDGMDDLIDDEQFRANFVRGISAQELRDNKIISTFRYVLEVIDNFLTLEAGVAKVEGEGSVHVAFMFGEEYGADVNLSGEGVKLFTKLPDTVDSGDAFGRLAFVTYKMAYGAQVVNSKAVYAIAFTPLSHIAAGKVEAAATSVPKE